MNASEPQGAFCWFCGSNCGAADQSREPVMCPNCFVDIGAAGARPKNARPDVVSALCAVVQRLDTIISVLCNPQVTVDR